MFGRGLDGRRQAGTSVSPPPWRDASRVTVFKSRRSVALEEATFSAWDQPRGAPARAWPPSGRRMCLAATKRAIAYFALNTPRLTFFTPGRSTRAAPTLFASVLLRVWYPALRTAAVISATRSGL